MPNPYADEYRTENLLRLHHAATRARRPGLARAALDAAAERLLPQDSAPAPDAPPAAPFQGRWQRVWPSGSHVRAYSLRIAATVKPAPGDTPAHIWTVTLDDGHIMKTGTAPSVHEALQAADAYAATLCPEGTPDA